MVEVVGNLRWVRRRAGNTGATTCLVQIVNKPHRIVILKVWHASIILLPIKYVAELVVEFG